MRRVTYFIRGHTRESAWDIAQLKKDLKNKNENENGPGMSKNIFMVARDARVAIFLFFYLLEALKENICQLWVLNTVDLSFCVRSTPIPVTKQ